MNVKKCMTTKVELGDPKMSLSDAAKKMLDGNFGLLPIQENDRLVGVITDRDITVRGVAEGCDPKTSTVREIMSKKVLYCYEDQTLDEVAKNLALNHIRRLPVLNRQKRLVGILSLTDLSNGHLNPKQLGKTMHHLSKNIRS